MKYSIEKELSANAKIFQPMSTSATHTGCHGSKSLDID